jgi:phosphate/phosphite/phosphonate ABC transporter binding protein
MANDGLARIGRYELEAKIAQGGMAEIFLARQPGIGGFSRRVVIKSILPLLADEPRFVQMFLEEARLASQIHHPNVVQIFDVGEEEDHYYIAMEYIDGLSIGAVVTQPSGDLMPLPIEIAAEIVIQACSGLHAAHQLKDENGKSMGLVHRDVSPQNLMVSRDGVVKLVDFGIAKAQDSSVTTRTGNIKGKYAYMSPEQVRGLPLDRRSDIFSLGTLLYELLTGHRLFHRNSELAILVAIIEDPFPAAHETNPEVPKELSDVIVHALQRDKDSRFATAAEMGNAVRQVIGELGLICSPENLSTYVEEHCQEQLTKRKGPGDGIGSIEGASIYDASTGVTNKPAADIFDPDPRDLDDDGTWDDAPTIPRDVGDDSVFVDKRAPDCPLGPVDFPIGAPKRVMSEVVVVAPVEIRERPLRSMTRGPNEIPIEPFGAIHDTAPTDKLLTVPAHSMDQADLDEDLPTFEEALPEDAQVRRKEPSFTQTIREDGPPASLLSIPAEEDPSIRASQPGGGGPNRRRIIEGWVEHAPVSSEAGYENVQKAGDAVLSRATPWAGNEVSRPSSSSKSKRDGSAGSGRRGPPKWALWIGLAVVLIVGAVGLSYLFHRQAAPTGPPLIYAHPPSLPETTLVKGLEPLAGYLAARLGRPVEVVSTPNYKALPERLISGEIDFANLPPLLYLQTKAKAPNLEILASHSSGGTTTYQSYIVARSDSKIRTVEQLEGHRFCYPDRYSTSGYIMPREFLRSQGLDPDELFSETNFSGNHAAVMEDIVAGRCDAGAVSSTSWVSARDLIGAKISQIVFIGSAGEIAWDVVCASPTLPASLRSSIQKALLDFRPQRDLGRQWVSPIFTIDAFVEPTDDFYQSLETLERAAIAEKLLEP